jgi:hypothetical protein
MKKSPKIDLNKAKILFQKRFFTCFSKIFKKFYLLFYVQKKTIKECPVPLDISIKSNRKHHKTVLYSKSNKNMVGRLFGQFFIVFGQFFNRNIWSPCSVINLICSAKHHFKKLYFVFVSRCPAQPRTCYYLLMILQGPIL